LFTLVPALAVTPALPLLLLLPFFPAPCGDDETAAATAHRSNYLKYLYAYECWRLHGEQLTKQELRERQTSLANKGESRALGLTDEASVSAGVTGGGGGAAPGSPGDPSMGVKKTTVTPPLKAGGATDNRLTYATPAGQVGGGGPPGRPGGGGGGAGYASGGGPAGGVMAAHSQAMRVGQFASGHPMVPGSSMGVAVGGAGLGRGAVPAGAGPGMGRGWTGGYGSMAGRDPQVPAGTPSSALTSYPSALPLKPIRPAAGVGGGKAAPAQLAPHANGHWFRQKRLWSEMEDASPVVAKATYPHAAARDLFETTATRFARIIELGVEPDLTFALSALAVMSADEQAPLWDPYASVCPKGASALILALCKSVFESGKQLRELDKSCSLRRLNPTQLEDPKCEWLFDEPPTLTKQGDSAANLLEKAVAILTILNNFVSGHSRIARAVAAERESVMLVLRSVAPTACWSDVVRLHASRVINRLAPFFEDERMAMQCAEMYAFLLGHHGTQQTAQVASVALEGLAILARRKDGGDVLPKILFKYNVLAWMDAEGFFHADAQVRALNPKP